VDVQYVNPFVESVQELFSTMLGCEAKRGKVGLVDGKGNPRDVTALIGLSGRASGMLTISFPIETALAIAGRMLGIELKVIDSSVSDAVAEMANIVAGSAKAKLTNDDQEPIDLGLPTVVRGNSYAVDYPSHATWLEVPFTSELGDISMRVTFRTTNNNGGGC